MINIHKFGRTGEIIATKYLKNKGHKILSTNFINKYGEIDIIVLETKKVRKNKPNYKTIPKQLQNEDVIVFVEVKSRRNNNFGQPSEAVDHTKQRKYQDGANEFLSKFNLMKFQYRFDIIEVFFNQVNHIENAF